MSPLSSGVRRDLGPGTRPADPCPGTRTQGPGSGTLERRAQVMGEDTFCDLHCIRDTVETRDNATLGTLEHSAQVMGPTQGPTQGL